MPRARKAGGYKGGYMGKILTVDLTTRKITKQGFPSDEILRKYIGCWGLGLRYLYDMLPPGYTTRDPENPLVFMTGPFTGPYLPLGTNTTLATKNFDTGFTVGRSHTHHNFGMYMKGAGFDGVIITGQSEKPVYLWIHDGQAELRDAGHIWGKTDTHQTQDVLREELGNTNISVASIGPCGENLVSGGMIMNDYNHGFSHSGVGSCMGAKKLKAIAVFGDKKLIHVADPERLKRLRREWITRIEEPGHISRVVHQQKSKRGEYRKQLEGLGFVAKNFQINYFAEFGLGFSQQKFTPRPCPGCPVGCSYDLEVTTGPYSGYVATLSGGGEGIEGSGAIFKITEPGAIFYLIDQYDRLGIECSTAGCTLGMAFEAFEKGLITSKDTDGIELRWGDAKAAEAMLRKMVYREGFGEILARGIQEAAELIGGNAPQFAVNVKGTGISLHDWRTAWGFLFSQIVGSGAGWPGPGADSWTAEPDAGFPEGTEPFDRWIKPLESRKISLLKFMHDSCGFCMFATWSTKGATQLAAETLEAVTGWDYTADELLEVGERVMQLERAFNVRHGLKPEDDWTVPDRLIEAPSDGKAKGISIKPYLEGMVKEYHRLMGWDPKTGKPWRYTLKKVGLDDVIKDLWD